MNYSKVINYLVFKANEITSMKQSQNYVYIMLILHYQKNNQG